MASVAFSNIRLAFVLLFAFQMCLCFVIKRTTVPHDAKPGYIVTSLPHWGQRLSVGSGGSYPDLHKFFSIQPNGDIITIADIAHFKGKQVSLEIVNKIAGESWQDTVQIDIVDCVYVLVFQHQRYQGHIRENEGPFRKVKGLKEFVVKRTGHKTKASYEIIKGPKDLFDIRSDDHGHLALVTKKSLDREKAGFYDLTVKAATPDLDLEPAICQIHVTVDDVNDNVPQFDQKRYITTIKENTPTHATILKLRAVDPDVGKISYHLVPCEMFEIHETSGSIAVKNGHNLVPGKYHMHAYAEDNGGKKSSPVRVLIKVRSDHHLRFEPRYSPHSRSRRAIRPTREIEISELSVGIIFNITNYPDGFSRYSFKPPPPKVLRIDSYNGSVSAVRGENNKSLLDYETSPVLEFTVIIRRQDNPRAYDEQPVRITLLDENDEVPKFVNVPRPFLATVSTSAPTGSSVYQLLATDDDENAVIRYSLESGGDDRFEVDERTGVVRTKGRDPFLSGREFMVGVAAFDQSSPLKQKSETNSLKIKVGERPPQFFQERYVAEVPENAKPSYRVIEVKAISHQGLSIRYDLRTASGHESRVFDISSETGTVELKRQLDYEKDPTQYHLLVRAVENGTPMRTSTVNLVVNLIDQNDNSPIFPLSQYIKHNIAETVAVGTIIINVTARDLDSGTNAHLKYTVNNDNFTVDSINNIGYIKTTKRLDYDRIPDHTYNFTVTATDHGEPPRQGTAMVQITVFNMNDESPVFSQAVEHVEVSEDASKNMVVHVVQAYDPDGDGVSYSFTRNKFVSGPFKIDPASGIITLVGDLDKSKVSYNLKIVAKDNGQCCKDVLSTRSSTGLVVVEVKDINNNAPRFPNCSLYLPTVPEEANLGTPIIKVKALDRDTGKNQELTYSLVKSLDQGSQKFSIEGKTGIIKSAEVFDREKVMEYGITVKAEDRGNPSLAGFCSFRVRVSDINDNKPVFDFGSYSTSIEESSPIGRRVIQVYAKDKDAGKNSFIKYYMRKDPSKFFQINQNNGWITVADAMHGRDEVVLEVEARDQGDVPQSTTVTVTIIITQKVNEYPKWVQDYALTPFKVNESASVNEVVARLKAVSSVPDTTVNYVIKNGDTPEQNGGGFQSFYSRIDETKNEMLIMVYRTLDFETIPNYTLTVKAANRAANSLHNDTRITIQVIDNNDEIPQFVGLNENGRYLGSVAENLPAGAEVITVSATDRDARADFKRVKYYIKPTGQDYRKFSINESTGVITTRKVFDREEKPEFYIMVVAEDMAPSDRPNHPPGQGNMNEAEIQIRVTDKNDNTPYFKHKIYNASIPENADRGTMVITVTADDDDEENGLSYSITEGNTGNVFEVKPDTGEIRVRGTLDYEQGPRLYHLTYRVFDDKYANHTRVVIRIEDVNDNAPSFPHTTYTVTNVVEEDKSITRQNPRFLLQVQATDMDHDRNPHIRYDLSGQFARDRTFIINKLNGKIYLTRPLDRDEPKGRAVWNFNVLAYDEPGSGQSLTGYAEVQVSPRDINDNAPEFDRNKLSREVRENSRAGETLSPVRAVDRDIGNNGTVEYSLKQVPADEAGNHLFDIDPRLGIIRTTMRDSLDREKQSQYTLIVQATDQGSPPHSASATYTINILDDNDNAPQFTQKIYKATMSESYPGGASVTSISATDADIGSNAELTYSLKTDDLQFFSMRSVKATNTGVLRVHTPVDYDDAEKRFFNLTVYVRDADLEHRDVAYIEVTVTDFNDNAPKFGPTQKVTVWENEKVGDFLATLTATDKDTGINAQFTYSINRKSDPQRHFSVNAKGEVKVIKPLDRETEALHKISVLAIDKGEPPQTGTGTLTVQVLDVNDNFPEFAEDYRPVVPENMDFPVSVLTLSATDRDGPTNGGPFEFWLPCYGACPCSGNPTCKDFAFDFVPRGGRHGHGTGQVTTKRVFDREKQKVYLMPIEMSDNGKPRMSGTNTLTIIIGDENDNEHFPGHKEIFVYNYKGWSGEFENARLGNVYAEDKDDWDRTDKIYKFVNKRTEKFFKLKQDDGELYLRKDVPGGVYNFEVSVFDKIWKKNVVSTVRVQVQEIGEDAVFNSGSIRLSDITAEEFVERPKREDGSDNPEPSKYDKLREELAELIGTDVKNVDIFTVMDHPSQPRTLDIRYSAHGSPYYKPVKLDGIVNIHKKRLEKLGLKIAMSPIDECIKEKCESGGCSNKLMTSNVPLVVNTNATSLVGVTAYISSKCECSAQVFQGNVSRCGPNTCLNYGMCKQEEHGYSCDCLPGFDGPHCEQTHVSFEGNGWAWYKPLAQCEDSHTSLEFMTTKPDGLLLYNGPMGKPKPEEVEDFILLELQDGYPMLRISHGSGDIPLIIGGLNSRGLRTLQPLNDGTWHRIDIYREGKHVRMTVDRCAVAEAAEDSENSSEDRSACETSGDTLGEHMFLNVNGPLQLGGRVTMDRKVVQQGDTEIQVMPQQAEFPEDSYTVGFSGCIKNLMHNGELYDLHLGPYAQYLNAEDHCPRQDRICEYDREGPKCGRHGDCVATLDGKFKCVCKPGYKGQRCQTATQPREFLRKSFLQWDFTDEYYHRHINTRLGQYQTKLQASFRTRESFGYIFKAQNLQKNEYIILEIFEKKIRFRYNLGSGEEYVALEHVTAADGQWHTVYVERFGPEVVLKMDSGVGRYYTHKKSALGNHVFIVLTKRGFFAGGDVKYRSPNGQPIVDYNFKGCLSDIRLNGFYLPMSEKEEYSSTPVDLVRVEHVLDNCTSNACVTTGLKCRAPLVCTDMWKLAECRCRPGYAQVMSPIVCQEINECIPDPCLKGVCVDELNDFHCNCPHGYSGKRCDIQEAASSAMAFVSTGAILAIVVSALVLLLVILIFIIYSRKREPENITVGVDPADDVRENIINYDEEGVGEEDQDTYDINPLKKPVGAAPPYDSIKKAPIESAPRQKERPRKRGRYQLLNTVPGEKPDVGTFINERLQDADEDPAAPPHDSVREYAYEGGGSDAGSLSSLASTSDPGDHNYDYLTDWGPRFTRLADMYGLGE